MRHHLAILYRPYLEEIMCGSKRIECRLGKIGYPPHGLVGSGDLIWLKETNGPVRAVASVAAVQLFHPLTDDLLDWVRHEFGDQIRAPAAFWRAGVDATAATLIGFDFVCCLRPFRIVKRDRRAWVPLAGPPIPGHSVRSFRGQLA